RISDELEWFKEEKPSRGLLKAISPLATAISMYRGPKKPKRKVKIWDPATEDYTIKATPEQITEYDMWRQEEKDVAVQKRELTGRLGVGRRKVQPGTKGGTFGDKIAESVKPQRQQRQQPTATKLRQRGTREAYEQGKRLGYWR
ncbi:hypothetical protein LCGC14_2579200, partial [marine sediment metagenome]